MLSRESAITKYLASLLVKRELLVDERQLLNDNAARNARIAEINVEVAEIDPDVDEALLKYNTITGQSLTVQQARRRFGRDGRV